MGANVTQETGDEGCVGDRRGVRSVGLGVLHLRSLVELGPHGSQCYIRGR